ncbi:tautomerase family protein [Pseudoalteromonas distincta]|uniref:4-oxalocrotonate tautomerase domain-containing protein n=1 Tax=marine sediment metagenome TaxID=412755 RepID=A0A0F9JR84_9ZZZZ|nr:MULTISPECIES: tautomerase family protein [Pseudoalteromonas]MBB1338409.1 tautomerase family protein [Pseudoalteromonas sp. SR44-2]MDC3212472.1 tautomerase family protein [Pseudoalteromonas distincta]MDN3384775.1 tautomerase family protein [Pseudoalteromonas sp. APC 3358]
MPLLKFDLIKGRTKDEVKTLLDSAHRAMAEAFNVPTTDRYQSVTQHSEEELILEDTGLNYNRTKDVVLLTVVSRQRTQIQKVKFYELLAKNLKNDCNLNSEDLIVSIIENGDSDWSFGKGQAQFITKEL